MSHDNMWLAAWVAFNAPEAAINAARDAYVADRLVEIERMKLSAQKGNQQQIHHQRSDPKRLALPNKRKRRRRRRKGKGGNKPQLMEVRRYRVR